MTLGEHGMVWSNVCQEFQIQAERCEKEDIENQYMYTLLQVFSGVIAQAYLKYELGQVQGRENETVELS